MPWGVFPSGWTDLSSLLEIPHRNFIRPIIIIIIIISIIIIIITDKSLFYK
jgi:hypothetical protein